MMKKFRIILGNLSSDGHGKTEELIFKSNKTVTEMQAAYKKSCKKFKFALDANTNIGRKTKDLGHPYRICTQEESCDMSKEVLEILKENNCPVYEALQQEYYCMRECFVELLMWLIGESIGDFQWKGTGNSIPALNDDGDFSEFMGYGLFTQKENIMGNEEKTGAEKKYIATCKKKQHDS